MGSDLGSQGDSREWRFANKELIINSKLETLQEANSEPGTKGIFKEIIPGPIYIGAVDISYRLLYLWAYSNAFKILKD